MTTGAGGMGSQRRHSPHRSVAHRLAPGVIMIGCAFWAASGGAQQEAPAIVAAGAGAGPTVASASWPAKVNATYRVSFNGFDVGEFRFTSQMSGSTYTLSGNAELSALLGAFTWSSQARASGIAQGETPQPAGYTFDFRSSNKGGSVKMGFANGAVASVSMVPPSSPSSGAVPVRDFHLKDALDPLTAVMAISRGSNKASPCAKKIPIFDGKQRFDLVLSYKRQVRITEERPSGQPTIGYVCRVRYIPLAGHKLNDETKQMMSNGGIEITLRAVPSANLFVPTEMTIPTVAGTAVLTSTRIDIVTPGQRQIAFGR